MRLICPNCGAQYEVDAKVIPDTGRDVQCSNCGNTWFQRPAEIDADLAQEMGFELATEDALPDAPTEAFEEPDAEPQVPNSSEEPYKGIPDTSENDLEPSENESSHDQAASEPATNPTPPVQRSAVSESVRDILRAEVAFDQTTRSADPLETQPDLGLEETLEQKKGLRERMARLRGLNPAEAAGGLAATASRKRRDLLPDIEEINSTLSAASERDDDGSIPDEKTRKDRAQRSEFTITFVTLIAVISLLILLYILAPNLAAKIPAMAGILESYVSGANALRGWLDTILTGASTRLNALLGQLNGS